jgi:hypothetical protein
MASRYKQAVRLARRYQKEAVLDVRDETVKGIMEDWHRTSLEKIEDHIESEEYANKSIPMRNRMLKPLLRPIRSSFQIKDTLGNDVTAEAVLVTNSKKRVQGSSSREDGSIVLGVPEEYTLSSLDPESISTHDQAGRVSDVLRHEIAHLKDIEGAFSVEDAEPSIQEDNIEQYLNNPGELRARATEIARQVKRGMDKYRDSYKPNSAFRLALSESESWNALSDRLDEKSRQYLLKKIYQHVRH